MVRDTKLTRSYVPTVVCVLLLSLSPGAVARGQGPPESHEWLILYSFFDFWQALRAQLERTADAEAALRRAAGHFGLTRAELDTVTAVAGSTIREAGVIEGYARSHVEHAAKTGTTPDMSLLKQRHAELTALIDAASTRLKDGLTPSGRLGFEKYLRTEFSKSVQVRRVRRQP